MLLFASPGDESRVVQAVEAFFPSHFRRIDEAPPEPEPESQPPPLFAWVHSLQRDGAEGAWVRQRATVLSQLDNIEVLSWKSNLALLQRRLPPGAPPTLDSEVILGEDHCETWCRSAFGQQGGAGTAWIVKDALANGGDKVWIADAGNWRSVVAALRAHGQAAEAEERAERGGVGAERLYVVQKYVQRPRLWPLSRGADEPGRKFHWRMFGLLRGDCRCFLWHRGFAHVANAPYTPRGVKGADFDRAAHITNAGVNRRDDPDGSRDVFAQYPEATFPSEQPRLWEQAQAVLGSVVGAAVPFLAQQRSGHDFALLGIDLLEVCEPTVR